MNPNSTTVEKSTTRLVAGVWLRRERGALHLFTGEFFDATASLKREPLVMITASAAHSGCGLVTALEGERLLGPTFRSQNRCLLCDGKAKKARR